MSWKVEMFPEEKKFIDDVFARIIESDDGYGPFIAPVRGGTIYLNDFPAEMTEDQVKWLVFVELQKLKYKHSGVQGLKFMNFTYSHKLPVVMEDPESMDKWGVKRMTTDGQPIDDMTGYPVSKLRHQKEIETEYDWDAEQKRYIKGIERVRSDYRLAESGYELPEKVLD